ncbi:ABC-2 type transport system permease protein [Paenibacillus endophyticus]|uniref:ABC-2 type transport system permease protein n=1 Tax=Paenibacillus endophyticus TaxID=1294268 RepID=A0A7W5GAX1_9BACL|nr:ABC-2 family transporter protein [Paenibacillus endophyticus]MBB3153729.1 ABC-2 type transport system permease protein [Paenibacillus endophyticus]
MRYASLFWEYIKNYAKTRLTYRADFWIEVLSDLLFQGMNLIFILIVFQHTPSLGGWSEAEVVFVYGFFMIPYGVFSTFFSIWNFSERYIVKGEMDRVLTRPAHSLYQVLLENVDPPSLIGSFVGAIIMVLCWFQLDLPFQLLDVLVMLLLILGAVLIYAGLYTALSAISFYSDAPTGIVPLMYNIQNYGRYPVNIYNKMIRFVLTWLLPFAFVGVIPASYFLEKKADDLSQLALLTPVMGIIVFSLGLFLWNHGVKRYRGAGS